MFKKKDVIIKTYEGILKNKNNFDMMRSELKNKSQIDESFIRKYILPLAQKIDPKITSQDILNFEKDALTQQSKLKLDELKNVSGGKELNVILSCGLLALMGFSGTASNVASAEFISFEETKEFKDNNNKEYITLGDVPFYQQADHLVDGVLWFKHPSEDKAFFIVNRELKDKEIVYSETSLPLGSEFKLLNIQDLEGKLKESFDEATKKSSTTDSVELVDDNPLYNFARFYNQNYKFNKASNRENLADIPMYANANVADKSEGLFKSVDFNPDLASDMKKIDYATKLKNELLEKNWTIAHRTNTKNKQGPDFNSIESSKNLSKHLKKDLSHTDKVDENTLRNTGFTFFTLQLNEQKVIPSMLNKDNLYEAVFDFKDIPLVSCSRDMLSRLNPSSSSDDTTFGGLFFDSSSDSLPPAFPCFNGSSEEVKEQIATYYINKLYEDSSYKTTFNEQNFEKNIEKILENINGDVLEVRVPTHVTIKDGWKQIPNTK